ncbi:ABC transporter ATP-binding protein [Clostridium perfringens]|uniref:ABC transporter ATP-binding protein n=1 Tax=Clostridium perfringens TaxID=1502 RepID=UPI0030CE1AF6
MNKSLRIRNLNVSYGEKIILNGVDIEINPGEFTVLLGLNGAGKTTLLKSIASLNKIDYGEIKYGETDLISLSDKERGKLISYIPQHIYTNQNYSVEDIILMGITPYLGVFEMPNKDHYRFVDEILNELNISHLKNKFIGELSGGERRLVYLGRILIQKCSILLLDEPNTFLDYVKQHDFFNFIKRLIIRKNLVTLVTLHDINLALRYGDRIVVLSDSKIVDSIDCREKDYEKKFIRIMEDIYERKLEIAYTEVGPFIIC